MTSRMAASLLETELDLSYISDGSDDERLSDGDDQDYVPSQRVCNESDEEEEDRRDDGLPTDASLLDAASQDESDTTRR